jgi:polysaccharide pyruvyl transferase WcaK-like protein
MINLFCIRPKAFNVGNDAIFLALQDFLREAFGQVVNIISLPATSRYESHAKAGLTAQTIYEINLYGHGVIVGGGNLYENGELEVDLNALEALEVPMMLFSLSRGRVYNRHRKLVDRTNAMPRHIAAAINRKAKFSLARDEYTGRYLQEIGAAHSRVGGCPTIFLNRIVDRLPRLNPGDQAGVLISVRNPSLMSIPLDEQVRVHGHIREIISYLHAQGRRDVRLLCHDHRDIPFAASFKEAEYVYVDDIYTYLALLRSCALSISYRLHAALPCFSFGRPAIPISYDERGLSLMRTLGLEDWNIDMIQSADVVKEVCSRYERLDELEIRLRDLKPAWKQLEDVMLETCRAFAAEVRA